MDETIETIVDRILDDIMNGITPSPQELIYVLIKLRAAVRPERIIEDQETLTDIIVSEFKTIREQFYPEPLNESDDGELAPFGWLP